MKLQENIVSVYLLRNLSKYTSPPYLSFSHHQGHVIQFLSLQWKERFSDERFDAGMVMMNLRSHFGFCLFIRNLGELPSHDWKCRRDWFKRAPERDIFGEGGPAFWVCRRLSPLHGFRVSNLVSDIKMLADDEDYIILTVVNDKYLVNFILGMKPPKLTKSRELDNRRWVWVSVIISHILNYEAPEPFILNIWFI